LPKQHSISPFERTGHDHASETAEDYVEAIEEIIGKSGLCRVTDLSSQFGVSHITALKIVRRLERDGYAITAPPPSSSSNIIGEL
jgi:DtxR family manganese transport transcriptional regulator